MDDDTFIVCMIFPILSPLFDIRRILLLPGDVILKPFIDGIAPIEEESESLWVLVRRIN